MIVACSSTTFRPSEGISNSSLATRARAKRSARYGARAGPEAKPKGSLEPFSPTSVSPRKDRLSPEGAVGDRGARKRGAPWGARGARQGEKGDLPDSFHKIGVRGLLGVFAKFRIKLQNWG